MVRNRFNIYHTSCDIYDTVEPNSRLDKWFYEKEFAKEGIKIVYFPYYKGTSSTLINETLEKLRKE